MLVVGASGGSTFRRSWCARKQGVRLCAVRPTSGWDGPALHRGQRLPTAAAAHAGHALAPPAASELQLRQPSLPVSQTQMTGCGIRLIRRSPALLTLTWGPTLAQTLCRWQPRATTSCRSRCAPRPSLPTKQVKPVAGPSLCSEAAAPTLPARPAGCTAELSACRSASLGAAYLVHAACTQHQTVQ